MGGHRESAGRIPVFGAAIEQGDPNTNLFSCGSSLRNPRIEDLNISWRLRNQCADTGTLA